MSKLTESIAELCDNATSVVNTVANAKDSGALYSLFKGTRGLGDFRSTHAALWLAHGLDVPLAKAGPQLEALGPNPRVFKNWLSTSAHTELGNLTTEDLVAGVRQLLQSDPVSYILLARSVTFLCIK